MIHTPSPRPFANRTLPIVQIVLVVLTLLVSACAGRPEPRASVPQPNVLQPNLAGITCNDHSAWIPGLRDQAKEAAREIVNHAQESGVELTAEQEDNLFKQARDIVMWRMVRTQLIGANYNNLGVVPLRGVQSVDGDPVILYRTGLTPDPLAENSCVRSLIESGGVRHIVNLYHGDIPSKDLLSAESKAITEVGGTYFDVGDAGEEFSEWRDHLRDSPAAKDEVATVVAELINDQILRPGGETPRGNLHVHCGGGMHRTGMVVGILQRCLNGVSKEAILDEYRRHVAWQNEDQTGGFEQGNIDFIFDFDCELLSF